MGLSSTNNRDDYTGNGSTGVYNYTFRAVNTSDIVVTLRLISTGVETTLTETTHYSVANIGGNGGTISLVDTGSLDWMSGGNLIAGYTLTIRRIVEITQTTDVRNQGDFLPEIHESQFDNQVMINQQQQDEIDRSVKLPVSIESSSFDTELPALMVGASKTTIVTNTAGNGFELGPSVDDIADAATNSAAAQAAAVSAAASAAIVEGALGESAPLRRTATLKPAANYILAASPTTSYGQITFANVDGDTTFVTLAANKFTLDPGEYRIKVPIGVLTSGWVDLLLYDETGAANEEEVLQVAYATSTANMCNNKVEFKLTVAAENEYSLKYKTSGVTGNVYFQWTTIDKIG